MKEEDRSYYCSGHGVVEAKLEIIRESVEKMEKVQSRILQRLDEIGQRLAWHNGKLSGEMENRGRISFLEGKAAGAAGIIGFILAAAAAVGAFLK